MLRYLSRLVVGQRYSLRCLAARSMAYWVYPDSSITHAALSQEALRPYFTAGVYHQLPSDVEPIFVLPGTLPIIRVDPFPELRAVIKEPSLHEYLQEGLQLPPAGKPIWRPFAFDTTRTDHTSRVAFFSYLPAAHTLVKQDAEDVSTFISDEAETYWQVLLIINFCPYIEDPRPKI